MLRINLLPPYVTQRRRTKQVTVGFVLLFILCVAGPLVIYANMKHHLTELTGQAETAESKKAANDALKALAVTTLAQVDPIKAKLDFVTAVHNHDTNWVKLWNTLADESPKSSFIYTDASVSGPIMTIKAYSPSVEEVGRYLQAMYQESDFQTVAVDHVPGYPDNVRHLYYLNGRLVFADGASGSSGSSGSGSSGSGGMGGYPGGSGGSSSGYPGGSGGMSSSGQSGGSSSSGPSNYNPQNLGPNGPSNFPPDVGPPPPELTGGAPASGGSSPSGGGGYPGGSGGGYPGGGGGMGGGQSSGGYSPAFLAIVDKNISPFALPETQDRIRKEALHHVVVKTVPKGFDITVTATLKDDVVKGLVPPSLPGAAPAAGAGGRPGMGGPGYPGGMGGRMGASG